MAKGQWMLNRGELMKTKASVRRTRHMRLKVLMSPTRVLLLVLVTSLQLQTPVQAQDPIQDPIHDTIRDQDADKNVTVMNETLRFAGPTKNITQGSSEELQFSYALSGLHWRDSSPSHPNSLSNAAFIVQKKTGLFQYLVQSGQYTISTLGSPQDASSPLEKNGYGPIPHAYLSINPNPEWSLQVGKLLSMPGFENPFTYQNQNIQRGLLENQNNTISQGAQLNYVNKKLTLFGTLNDGFYSGQLTWLGLGGSYQFNDRHSSNWMIGGAYKPSSVNTAVTPLLQNNSQILNLIHRIQWGAWSLTPYYQLTLVPSNSTTQLHSPARTEGYAFILNRSFEALNASWLPQGSKFHLPLRVEQIKVSEDADGPSHSSVFGHNTQARSWTLTPTLQSGIYFLRAEWSRYQLFQGARSSAPTSMQPLQSMQPMQNSRPPLRFLLEWGFLY